MKKWKILIAGVAITVFDVIVGMVTCGWLFHRFTDLSQQMSGNLWKGRPV
jgi:hypothetical protein